jgi:hypothetical protein
MFRNREKKIRDDVRFSLNALSNCVVHPKFLDDDVVRSAALGETYLEFALDFHGFIEDVEERYAAGLALPVAQLVASWHDLTKDVEEESAELRIAQAYFRRLIENLTAR